LAAAERVHLFGIRHHGPGCAWSLERALDERDPAIVLVEGPAEADELIPFVTRPAMRPPIALLVHASDDPTTAFFFPFAEFSPEWRALRWAVRHERPVRFIDLPIGHRIARGSAEPVPADTAAGPADPSAPLRFDPLSRLAALAGYDDGETWWNALIEEHAQTSRLFPAIELAMAALREATEPLPDPADRLLEDRREAHMRLAIRAALTETEGAVAVVTGAWHVPALRRKVPATEDRALLKGLPRTPVTATWIPWTDARLAGSSGYQAGVISPGWYRHVFAELCRHADSPQDERVGHAARWLARVASLLRAKGLPVSPASVIEATRLGLTLAVLRDLALPGLAELRDATLSGLCFGEETPHRLIESELVIGTEVGEVDPEVPQMPLQADLARWQRKLRLEPKALEEELAFDLRTETGLAKSILLHRLELIEVPWGSMVGAGRSRGTFRERWVVAWQPEYSVRVAEALRWGSTVEQAAGNAALERAGASQSVGVVAEVVRRALLADLADPAERAMERLQALAARTGEVTPLMEALPPLAQVLRYGTARRLPEAALRRLVNGLVIEVSVGLAPACHQLDSEQAEAMCERLTAMDHAVSLLDSAHLTEDWRDALRRVAEDDRAAAMPRGGALRRLHDRGLLDPEALARHVSRALSRGVPPTEAGAWIEGFLGGAGQVLLHDHALFGALDGWLQGLEGDTFTTVLPTLRRGFGTLERGERRRLLEAVRQGGGARGAAARPEGEATPAGYQRALPLLKRILGIP
jgi:hypothetical protein